LGSCHTPSGGACCYSVKGTIDFENCNSVYYYAHTIIYYEYTTKIEHNYSEISHTTGTPITVLCRLVEGARAEVYTVVIILAIVLVYTDSHDTGTTTSFGSLNQPANPCIIFHCCSCLLHSIEQTLGWNTCCIPIAPLP
jgi:hypothetical protein